MSVGVRRPNRGIIGGASNMHARAIFDQISKIRKIFLHKERERVE
jgi:hypothetical protein